MTHTSVNQMIISSDNGFVIIRCQTSTWNNAHLSWMGLFSRENTFENAIGKMAAILLMKFSSVFSVKKNF